MFRSTLPPSKSCNSFPRIRGDVPQDLAFMGIDYRFSPHTRGCSRRETQAQEKVNVFPAYAGMFRSRVSFWCGQGGFPRIRGDVPPEARSINRGGLFSPHTRGCSQMFEPFVKGWEVFPAYAGMFRRTPPSMEIQAGFPRIRGDVPEAAEGLKEPFEFSPHTRGCSQWQRRHHRLQFVFPAYAGMFPTNSPLDSVDNSFPRIRGDVPSIRLQRCC